MLLVRKGGARGRAHLPLSAIIVVADFIFPTPPILANIALAWHRGSVRPRLPTPLQSSLDDAEESIRFSVVPQKPTLILPPEDINSSRTIDMGKDRSGIWTRIRLFAERFKMKARLARALRGDIQPSARRARRRILLPRFNLL